MGAFFGITEDTWTKIVTALMIPVGGYFSYRFGKRQEIASKEKTDALAAENARLQAAAAQTTADAALQNADTAEMTARLVGGRDTLKTLIDGADAYLKLQHELQEYGKQLTEIRVQHAKDIGDITAKHSKDIGELTVRHTHEITQRDASIANLRTEVTDLRGQVVLLRSEIKQKDKALEDCDGIRAERDRLRKRETDLLAEMVTIKNEAKTASDEQNRAIADLRAENATLKEKVKNLEWVNNGYTEQLDECIDEKERLNAQLTTALRGQEKVEGAFAVSERHRNELADRLGRRKDNNDTDSTNNIDNIDTDT